MSCLLAVTTDLPACQRAPDEIACRLEAAHQLDDDIGIGGDDRVDAVGPLDVGRHPVDFLPLDSAIADRRQLQRRMNPARQHLRDRAADGAKADDGDFRADACLRANRHLVVLRFNCCVIRLLPSLIAYRLPYPCCPGLIVTGSRNGIMPRSCAPTCSI